MSSSASSELSANEAEVVSLKKATASAFMKRIYKLASQLSTFKDALVEEQGDHDATILRFLENVFLVADESVVANRFRNCQETQPALAPLNVSLVGTSLTTPIIHQRELNEYSVEAGAMKLPFTLTFASEPSQPELTQTIVLGHDGTVAVCLGKRSKEELDDIRNLVSRRTATRQDRHVSPRASTSVSPSAVERSLSPPVKIEPIELPFHFPSDFEGDSSNDVDNSLPFLSSPKLGLDYAFPGISNFADLFLPSDNELQQLSTSLRHFQSDLDPIIDAVFGASPSRHRSEEPPSPTSFFVSPSMAVENEIVMRRQVKFEGRRVSKRTHDQSDDSDDDLFDEDRRPTKRIRTPTPAPESMRSRKPPSTPEAMHRELSRSSSPAAAIHCRSSSTSPTPNRTLRRSARLMRSI